MTAAKGKVTLKTTSDKYDIFFKTVYIALLRLNNIEVFTYFNT